MNTTETETSFPVEWEAWRAEWWAWHARTTLRPTSYKFPAEKNILADEILGVFGTDRGAVELSELTMPDFGSRPRRTLRYIGLTWAGSGGADTTTGIVRSWAELDEALGVTR